MTRPQDSYPLAAVEGLRERAETSATEALADALRELVAREQQRSEAIAALGAHRQQEAGRDREQARTTAAAWAVEELYRARQREHERTLEDAVDDAAEAEKQARAVVRRARKALGGAAQERAVVAAHRGRWQADKDRERDRREEDELETWSSR
ncbi:MAG: hypothetical protein AB8I08_19595 [Sandaracinaceae bacterium]